MIELSHVTKTFGGAKRALDDLTLTVPQGAVYGLVGSNGAGKTTAIRHITGIFRPDSGSVTIGGLPVYENPPVKSRIGYIPDDLGVFGGGTLRELAAFFRTMYPRFDAKRYAALRDVFRLDESTPLRRFSKGMQKHAAFWLTLCIRQYGVQLALCLLLSTNLGTSVWAALGKTKAGRAGRLLFLLVVLGLSVLSMAGSGMQAFIYAQF